MGFQLASLRQSNVVMAPVCTSHVSDDAYAVNGCLRMLIVAPSPAKHDAYVVRVVVRRDPLTVMNPPIVEKDRAASDYFQHEYDELLDIMTTDVADKETNGDAEVAITSFERALLNQVDEIGMEEVGEKPPVLSDRADAQLRKCAALERRAERLAKRLRAQKSRLVGVHCAEQATTLLDYCRRRVDETEPLPAYVRRLRRCSDNTSVAPRCTAKRPTAAPRLPADVLERIDTTAGQLRTQTRSVASDFDSDATASSSGADSMDEEQEEDDRSRKIPLTKRAIWRWLRNRAKIAFRMSWLQSYMSALEYKIHHYTEMHRRIRSQKGPVLSQEKGTSSPAKPTVVPNGYHGSPVKADDEETCSRARPLSRKFRKRTVVRSDVGEVSADVSACVGYQRYGTMRCECAGTRCALCVARGAGIDLSVQHTFAGVLPVRSKLALLEATYHPVLSYPQEISASTHINSLLNNTELRFGAYSENRGGSKETNSQVALTKRYAENFKTSDQIRKSNSENLEMFKKRRKYIRRAPTQGRSSQLGKRRNHVNEKQKSFKKRRRRRLRAFKLTGTDSGLDESGDEGHYYQREGPNCSQPGSPHSSHSSNAPLNGRRKKGEKYDIHNFIIPLNNSALALNKPRYKEILIPKWKLIDEPGESLTVDSADIPPHIREDLSDDKILSLHETLEAKERVKFRTQLTRRSRKRTESCPETSETNTPERVMSPAPSNTNTDSNDTIPSLNAKDSGASGQSLPSKRARTISTSKLKQALECDNDELANTDAKPPYEKRVFPLSEEEYREILNWDPHLDNNLRSYKVNSQNENGMQTPLSESADSMLEDPDDPDWTQNDEFEEEDEPRKRISKK